VNNTEPDPERGHTSTKTKPGLTEKPGRISDGLMAGHGAEPGAHKHLLETVSAEELAVQQNKSHRVLRTTLGRVEKPTSKRASET